ncbi:MAG: EFR1 family ferrodoxin [Methanoregulaceae archaeon]|jgi:ferredoxin|nr:EFR1 family ferrodoxin [Methanoregulaceae archaeon]
MKTILYYFTGTGNSLAVAEGLCRRLPDCELVPIASVVKSSGRIAPEADRVGITAPVYFSGLPAIVADFSLRLDLSKVPYSFAVLTLGGSGGTPALHQLERILTQGPGKRGLDAGFTVKMPGNYVLMYSPPNEATIAKILAQADRRVEEIAGMVEQGVQKRPSMPLFGSLVQHLIYPRFVTSVHDADRKFTVDDRCTSCGRCVQVCPVENIRLEEGRPVWLHHCEQCMACIQLCPALAIQAGNKTEKRDRYCHPGLRLKSPK